MITSNEEIDEEVINLNEFFEKNMDRENAKVKTVALDMWSAKTFKSHNKAMKINKFLKPFKLSLLKIIIDTLNNENIDIMVYAGTALAVWRDKGNMIPHDHDIDLAVLESEFLKVYRSLNKRDEIYADSICPFTQNSWFDKNCTEQILYNKVGIKRMKIYFTDSYLENMSKCDKKFQKLMMNYDRTKLFIDIFVLQKNIETNKFYVSWNIPGLYNIDRKGFPEEIILPMKNYIFESIPILGPNDIEKYLKIEYGYLGKDACYDSEQQLYVKLNQNEFEILPNSIKDYMLH